MKLSINDIAKAIGCSDMGSVAEITDVLADSRSVTNPAQTLFVALRTANNDGHSFISQLAARGVRNFVVDHRPDNISPTSALNFMVVTDTLAALRQIGSLCRSRIKGTVVAITGSRGKTVVKENIFMALQEKLRISRSPRSYNSQIGVPLSLAMADDDADLCLIEAGISRPGEMQMLAEMIRPEIGILTEITSEHDESFESRRQKIDEKLLLFADCHTIIYAANPLVEEALAAKYPEKKFIRVSATDTEGINRLLVDKLLELIGADDCKTCKLHNVNTRLDVIEGVNDCKIILDRFTPDLLSLRLTLDYMRRRVPTGWKSTAIVAINNFIGTTAEICATAKTYGIDRLIIVGNAQKLPPVERMEIEVVGDTSQLSAEDFYKEVILMKDSTDFVLDSLYSTLEAKQHETLMEVSLDAIVHNFNFFRSKVKSTTGVICMLKAHGYGAGSVELARTLQSHGAAYLAVAVVDEGVELRHAGISMPIMVLNPRAQNYRVMFDNRLEPEIYSFEMLDDIIRSAEKCGVRNFPVHIKLETGMRRLGFVKEDLPKLCERLRNTDRVVASTVFSHLACADDPAEDDYTRMQFAYFNECCDIIDKGLPVAPKRHILNSTGIVRFPEMQYDFVRLGIGLYGIPTMNDGSMSELRNVSRLSSVIISLKHWPAGTTIGYNRRGRLERDSVIATIPVGYADGIDRHLGYGNTSFVVNGSLCPTVGSICMDICMIDVTDVDCHVGNRVEIFGDRISPVLLAQRLGTIPYEILTSISPRVKRVYYRD